MAAEVEEARVITKPHSAEWYQALGEASPNMVWLTDDQAQVVWVNRQWLEFRGRDRDAEMGEGWLEGVHPEDRQRLTDTWLHFFYRRQEFEVEYRILNAQAEYRWVMSRGGPFFLDGTFQGFTGSAIDIQERKTLEQELRDRAEALADADRRKDEFLAMLAHELRNPLGAISNAVYVLNQGGPSEERRRALRQTCDRQVRHLTRIVDDLMDVSRITRGMIQLRKEPYDLVTLVQRSVDAMRPFMEGRGHAVTLSLPTERVVVEVDATRIEQVVANLLTNAAKYTDTGGRIDVFVDVRETSVAVRVRDTGMGIPRELQPRVFELFSQAKRSLARSEGGLGIGLTLVRTLVELHGGQVAVFSEGVGQGSEFCFVLPHLLVAPESGSQIGELPEPETARTLRVAIVEDNRDAADTLAELLGTWGHESEVAVTGGSGIDLVRRYRPDVVLCDLGLPGIDGYEVAQQLRSDPLLAGIRLIAVSGYGQETDRQASREAGFEAHLTKPVDLNELQRILGVVAAAR